MIDQDRQSAVLTLSQQGMHRKQIARTLHLNIKTVCTIISNGIRKEKPLRKDSLVVDEKLLEKLYHDCDGYIQRVFEILTEEHHIAIGYSTLTRLIRSKEYGSITIVRSAHTGDIPGEEMQHDTTEYRIRIGPIKYKIICSGIYLRYSKMRYIKFYRRFNRFTMKCFLDEALRHWNHCARKCIIDNTNLAILHGSGSNAVIHPEMRSFGQNYGFTWKAHAIGHANRKAGTERNFWTVETNFLPGRTFTTLEDLNTQALQWATVHYANRPQSKTKSIPLELFETEKSLLQKLPEYVCPPYLQHSRLTDPYGYISFDGNYYWVPQEVKARTLTVLQYASYLRIMNGLLEVAKYDIAPDGVKNEMFIPPESKVQPRQFPNNRKHGCEQEEKQLKDLGAPITSYIDMINLPESGVRQRPAFIRELYAFYRQWGKELFTQTIQRALTYNVNSLDMLSRIATQIVKTTVCGNTPCIEADDDYLKRPAYRDGRFSEENGYNYDQLS